MKYNTGASNISGSLGGVSESALSTGFEVTSEQASPFNSVFGVPKEDCCGTNIERDKYGQNGGALTRPNGNER